MWGNVSLVGGRRWMTTFRSVTQSCPTLCDPMNHSTPGLPVHHQLPESTQTHVHRVSDAIQLSHPLSSPSPSAPNPSQPQSFFQWVNSSHEAAKVLEFQLQHHSFQRNPRAYLLQNGLVRSPCSPRESQESSPTPQFKSLLMKVKLESEKVGLKLNIQKMKIMASGPITSWQIDGETVETVSDFIFLGSKITADVDCSHEIKTLTPWKESYDQPR